MVEQVIPTSHQSADAFAGLHEYFPSADGLQFITRPNGLFLAAQNPVPGQTNYDQTIWHDYQGRMPESGRLMEQCQAASMADSCNARVALWNDFVTSVKGIGLDGAALLQLTNVMANELINYDNQTLKNTQKSGNHNQTPYNTLEKGSGICTDIALLKYETLRAFGLDDKDMRLITGVLQDKKGQPLTAFGKPINHMMLMVNLDGRNYVLNNNMVSDGWRLQNGGLEPDTIFLRGGQNSGPSVYNSDGLFVPLTATNQDGTRFFLTKDPKTGLLNVDSAFTAGPPITETDNQIHAGNSSISLSQKIDPKDAEKIRELIQRAHDLNDMNRKAPALASGEVPPSPESHLATTWDKPPPQSQDEPAVQDQKKILPTPPPLSVSLVDHSDEAVARESRAAHPERWAKAEIPDQGILPTSSLPSSDPIVAPPSEIISPSNLLRGDHSNVAVPQENPEVHLDLSPKSALPAENDESRRTNYTPDVAVPQKHARHGRRQHHQSRAGVRHGRGHHRHYHKSRELMGGTTPPTAHQIPQINSVAYNFTIGSMRYHAEMNPTTHQVVLGYTHPDGRTGVAWPTNAYSLGQFIGQGNVDHDKAQAIDRGLGAGGHVLAGRQQARDAQMNTGGSG